MSVKHPASVRTKVTKFQYRMTLVVQARCKMQKGARFSSSTKKHCAFLPSIILMMLDTLNYVGHVNGTEPEFQLLRPKPLLAIMLMKATKYQA